MRRGKKWYIVAAAAVVVFLAAVIVLLLPKEPAGQTGEETGGGGALPAESGARETQGGQQEMELPAELANQDPIPLVELTGVVLSETTKVMDADGNILYVPGGFAVSAESADLIREGVVIVNEAGDKEFVWIPVDEEDLEEMYQEAPGTELYGSGSQFETTTVDVYSKLRMREGELEDYDGYEVDIPGGLGLREPDILVSYEALEYSVLGAENIDEVAREFVREYEAVYQSTKLYNGFYIGRFELTGTPEEPTVARGQEVQASMSWYRLRNACSAVVSTPYAQSAMIYGNQWDEVMDWLLETGEKTDEQINTNSADWGNYANSTGPAAVDSDQPQPAGTNEAWSANNIYDLAGNFCEWTQEAFYNSIRVVRGGSYESSAARCAADREHHYNTPTWTMWDQSSRPVLYIVG